MHDVSTFPALHVMACLICQIQCVAGAGEDLQSSRGQPAGASEYSSVFGSAPVEYVVDGRDRDTADMSGDDVLGQSDDLTPYNFDADLYYFQEYSEV